MNGIGSEARKMEVKLKNSRITVHGVQPSRNLILSISAKQCFVMISMPVAKDESQIAGRTRTRNINDQYNRATEFSSRREKYLIIRILCEKQWPELDAQQVNTNAES